MDSSDVTKDQARQMHRSLFKLANYLWKTTNRMERRGFPLDDDLYRRTKAAYDAVCSLCMELHYMSCDGVGKPRRGEKK
jgi:hypothetical protein